MKMNVLLVGAALAAGLAAAAGEPSPLVPFGAQSGRPTEADVVKTLETAKAAGYAEFLVYPRSGLEYAYMGEEWLALVGQYLRHAERLGMGIWLYDEFNWPSGSCRGRVPEGNDDFRSTSFALYPKADGTFEWRYFRSDPLSANVFDVEAMNRFRALTHEVYERRFRRFFGTVIRGIFTDEPGSHFWMKKDPGFVVSARWYRGFERDYRAETGRDFKADVEAYARDNAKTEVWRRYTAVMGHAFRRAFADPITAWCDRLGIVSTGHLMSESDPCDAAVCNGLALHVLKGFSCPGIDEIFSQTSPETVEWLTFATAQHAIGRRGRGGVAELFALGPCDLAFDKQLQMIWLSALHKVDTYLLSLHHQTARGFVEKPHYAMFTSPLQPWFFDQEAFHDAARVARTFARKPFRCDVAVRYPQRAAGLAAVAGRRAVPPPRLVELLRTLGANQVTCDLYEEDEPCDAPLLFDFEGAEIVERRSGRRFAAGADALDFVRARLPDAWRLEEASGRPATALLMRRYDDGTAAVLNLSEDDRALVFAAEGRRLAVSLPGRGVWLYRPVAARWTFSTDRPNCRRIRFLADGTARLNVARPVEVRFATCALTNAACALTLDGRPLAGTRPCTFLGFGYDGDYAETERMTLAAGEHVLTCSGREDRGQFLPALFMEGSFSAEEPGTILPPRTTVPCGPLEAVGYGDFAGKATYAADVAVPKDAERLTLATGHALASVRLAGRDLGTRLRAPWSWPVPAALRGQAVRLEITLATSIRPRFGRCAEEVKGAWPSDTPKWVRTIPLERGVGLNFALWQ